MANALDAAMFSVEKGNTGVGSKKTTLEAIDKGALAVKSWKDGIDADRLKLKTDTADRYREAEKLAQEKIGAMQPNNKTERDLVIKGLASYKDQLYNNMQLVKNGVIKPDENTIFQSNGKQTFDIISQQIASQAEQTNLSLERAKGGYWPDEEGGPDVFHEPVAGAIEAKLQEIQNAVSNPQFTNINFGRDGMGEIEFYKTKLNPATNTMELDLDADGEPQRNENFSLSILALDKNRNQRADVFYLNKEVNALVKDGPLGNTFEVMSSSGKMYNSILDYQMENPDVEELIDDASAVATSTVERVASILTDNGTQAERSIPTTPSEWADLTDDQKKETISYSYLDSKGERKIGKKYKYMEMQVSSNNTIVPVFREAADGVRGDEEVARDMATSSIIAAIEKDYTDKGAKASERVSGKTKAEFDNDARIKKEEESVLLIDQAATGQESSLKAVVNASTLVKSYRSYDDGGINYIQFTATNGDLLAPIPMNTPGVDAGKMISSQSGLIPPTDYINNTQLADGTMASSQGYLDYNASQAQFTGVDNIVFGMDSQGVEKTASDLFLDAGKDSGMIAAAFDKVVNEMVSEYGYPSNFLTIEVYNTGGTNDAIKIIDSACNIIADQEDDDTNAMYIKNALKKYLSDNSKEQIESGTTPDVG